MRRAILILAAMTALAACARPEVTRTVPVDPDFKVTGSQWSTGHLMYITTKARNFDGRVNVCGAVGVFGGTGAFKEQLVTRYLERSTVRLDGEKVFQGLQTFVVVEAPEPVRLTRANCVKTERVWSDDEVYAITVSAPRYIETGS